MLSNIQNEVTLDDLKKIKGDVHQMKPDVADSLGARLHFAISRDRVSLLNLPFARSVIADLDKQAKGKN